MRLFGAIAIHVYYTVALYCSVLFVLSFRVVLCCVSCVEGGNEVMQETEAAVAIP